MSTPATRLLAPLPLSLFGEEGPEPEDVPLPPLLLSEAQLDAVPCSWPMGQGSTCPRWDIEDAALGNVGSFDHAATIHSQQAGRLENIALLSTSEGTLLTSVRLHTSPTPFVFEPPLVWTADKRLAMNFARNTGAGSADNEVSTCINKQSKAEDKVEAFDADGEWVWATVQADEAPSTVSLQPARSKPQGHPPT